EPLAAKLSRKVPVVKIDDIRRAAGIEAGLRFGPHRFTPGFSYSEEGDYISRGASFNYAFEFNDRNTTLNLGWAHNWDSVLRHGTTWERKNNEDYLVGVSQLLGPKTVFSANFTLGTAYGYLADQYKGVLFDGFVIYRDPADTSPIVPSVVPEVRPNHRERYVGQMSLTQAIT